MHDIHSSGSEKMYFFKSSNILQYYVNLLKFTTYYQFVMLRKCAKENGVKFTRCGKPLKYKV